MKGQLYFLLVYICLYTYIIHAKDTHLVFWCRCTIYVFLCFFIVNDKHTTACHIRKHIDSIPNGCKNTKQRIIRIRITYWSTQIIDLTTVKIIDPSAPSLQEQRSDGARIERCHWEQPWEGSEVPKTKHPGHIICVDGWNPAPVEVGSLSEDIQGFVHPRWCRISSINSIFWTLTSLTSYYIIFLWLTSILG